jgi:hypothetical protein
MPITTIIHAYSQLYIQDEIAFYVLTSIDIFSLHANLCILPTFLTHMSKNVIKSYILTPSHQNHLSFSLFSPFEKS